MNSRSPIRNKLVIGSTAGLAVLVIIILIGSTVLPNLEAGGSSQILQNYSFVKEWRFDTRPVAEVGIATDMLGNNVYITDSARHKILKFSSNGTFLMQWGKEGTADGEFREPTDVALDSQGNVYVTEHYGGRVQKFTENGKYLTQWNVGAEGQLGIAVDRSTDWVYVADTGFNQILKYSSDGAFISSIGGNNSLVELSYPMDVALDSKGDLFVADSHNNRILKFSSNGTYLKEWKKFDGFTDIWNPVSLSLDASGTMYIASSGLNKLHQSGAYGGILGSSKDTLDLTIDNANGYAYAIEGNFGTVVSKYSLKDGGRLVSRWLPQNPADNIVGSITSMKTDLEGNLYILDSVSSRIHKYSHEGKVLARWGFPGSGDGEFGDAADMALDRSGNVYVIDADHLRVQKFTSDGQLIGKWGGGLPDSIPGGFYWPRTIAANSQGTVLIGDTPNERISMFTANGTYVSDWDASSSASDLFPQIEFHQAQAMEFDSLDNLYMTNFNHADGSPYTPGIIVKFNEAREPIAAWDSFEGRKLGAIADMALDVENNVFVTDAENSVMKFTGDGNALAKWNPVAADDDMPEQISAITVDYSGLVYVADVDEWLQQSRIQIFAPEGSSIADRAPSINVPPGGLVVVNATDPDSFAVNVTYAVIASDDHDKEGSIIPSCSPPSGSTFLVGYNMTVVCIATDSAGNTASKGFVVRVNAPVVAYAQETREFSASVVDLGGRYVNSEAGVDVTFPDGWAGNISESELQLEGLVIPGGLTGSEPPKAITLIMYPKPSDTARDPFNLAKATNGRSDCNIPTFFEHRTVSGVDAADVTVECTETGYTLRTIGVETNDTWLALTYHSLTPEYEADLAKFEATVDSLKVRGAVNATFGIGGFLKITHSDFVTVGGKSVEIKFATPADIFDTQLDEETKTLSFRYIGGNVSAVESTDTEVLVGTVLKGPYVVIVDDIEATSQGALYHPGIEVRFFGTSVAYPGIESVIVEDLPGEHEVKITGTQVVPEFPTAALGVIATLTGIATLVGRTRLAGSRIRQS